MNQHRSFLKRMKPPTKSCAYLLLILTLTILTLRQLSDLPTNVCAARKNAHQHILDALPYREQPIALQAASSAYLRVASLPEARNCRPLTVPYSKIERIHSAPALHNVLIYIAAVVGATKKTFIEIDSAREYGQWYTASAFTQQAWSAVVLQERWSAYEACRIHYEPIQKS